MWEVDVSEKFPHFLRGNRVFFTPAKMRQALWVPPSLPTNPFCDTCALLSRISFLFHNPNNFFHLPQWIFFLENWPKKKSKITLVAKRQRKKGWVGWCRQMMMMVSLSLLPLPGKLSFRVIVHQPTFFFISHVVFLRPFNPCAKPTRDDEEKCHNITYNLMHLQRQSLIEFFLSFFQREPRSPLAEASAVALRGQNPLGKQRPQRHPRHGRPRLPTTTATATAAATTTTSAAQTDKVACFCE